MENSSSLPLLVSPRVLAAAETSTASNSPKEMLSLPAIDKLSVDVPTATTNVLLSSQGVTVDDTGGSQDDLAGLMRFIHYDHFQQLKEFPRYPQCHDICTNLEQIDRQNSLIVFVSHMWLAGWHGAKDWRGKPHPDNKENAKFVLCREGIDALFKNLAVSMKDCYVWLDFGCIDQDSDACAELRVLDKIVGYCDVILTPIVDDDFKKPNLSPATLAELLMSSNIQNNDGAPIDAWRSYLSRAWCRMEMFLASQVPIAEAASQILMLDENQRLEAHQRRLKMSKHLGVAMLAGRRPHFFYSTTECFHGKNPIVLAPLLHSYLDEFSPAKGELTKETDRPRVIDFMQKVTPKYQKVTIASYVGEKDLTTGKREGKGKEVFANGDVFDGLYVNDKHTTGVLTYCTFNVYTGDFNELGERHGLGKMEYFFGNTCYGLYEHNVLKFGIMEYANGTHYVGEFADGSRHGIGMYISLRKVHLNGGIAENVTSAIDKVGRDTPCFRNPIGEWQEDSFVRFKKAAEGDDDDVLFKTIFSTLTQLLESRPENDVLRQAWHTRDVLQDYNQSKLILENATIDTLTQWVKGLNNTFAAAAKDVAILCFAANILTIESLCESVVAIPTFLLDIGITTERFGESFTHDFLDKCKHEYMFHWMEKNKQQLGYHKLFKDQTLAVFIRAGISTAEQLVEMDLPENEQKRTQFFAKVNA